VLTLLALGIGDFAIGLVVTLGQAIQAAFSQRFTSSTFDMAIVAGAGDRAAVERQLARTAGLTDWVVNTIPISARIRRWPSTAGRSRRSSRRRRPAGRTPSPT
jgi:hypothetical protein